MMGVGHAVPSVLIAWVRDILKTQHQQLCTSFHSKLRYIQLRFLPNVRRVWLETEFVCHQLDSSVSGCYKCYTVESLSPPLRSLVCTERMRCKKMVVLFIMNLCNYKCVIGHVQYFVFI